MALCICHWSSQVPHSHLWRQNHTPFKTQRRMVNANWRKVASPPDHAGMDRLLSIFLPEDRRSHKQVRKQYILRIVHAQWHPVSLSPCQYFLGEFPGCSSSKKFYMSFRELHWEIEFQEHECSARLPRCRIESDIRTAPFKSHLRRSCCVLHFCGLLIANIFIYSTWALFSVASRNLHIAPPLIPILPWMTLIVAPLQTQWRYSSLLTESSLAWSILLVWTLPRLSHYSSACSLGWVWHNPDERPIVFSL